MPRPYILSECTYDQLLKREVKLAVLPWAATEAHNYHLPYGTDIYEARELAAEAARKAWGQGTDLVVLPTIPFGVNTGQTDIFLDINMYPSTQAAILNDVIEVLNRQGVRKLVIFNSHGGNNFRQMLRELGVRYPQMFLTETNWFKAIDRDKFLEERGDHADELETSLMMYIEPELVRALDKAGDGKAKKWKVKALNQDWAWAERQWSKVTKDTGVGNPYKSTKQKGKECFDSITDQFSEFFIDLAAADLEDLYVD